MKTKKFIEVPLNEIGYNNLAAEVSYRYRGGAKKIYDFIEYKKAENKYGVEFSVLFREDTDLNLIFELGYVTGVEFQKHLTKK